ncbi:hypothetical protein CRG98_042141 [Punica granatum]|uniref:Polygalacturonase At3g15720 n=1 Tax=Punica granatum TaxID=22663 RepID=A0A2I0I0H6_PUNGR|nr:hypothetical protein CRG98_042141 [Punica granatum]
MFGALISAVLLIGVVDCQTFNVLNYGAAADGQKDDSPAFAKAWKDVCNSTGKPTLHIPAKRAYLLNPVAFSGPCKSGNINVDLWGTLQAPASPSAWKGLDQSRWIIFKNVNGLKIAGPGLVDGRGQQWWSISCQHNPGKHLQDIRSIGDSIDSDQCQYNTGDDCVSIGDQCSNINVTGLVCGPGHGVSQSNSQVGRGIVKRVDFSFLKFTNVDNPIIIDQFYCARGKQCANTTRGVQISEVTYNNLFGTSRNRVAVNLACNNIVPCTNINLNTVDIKAARRGQTVVSKCNNAYGRAIGSVKPAPCLK